MNLKEKKRLRAIRKIITTIENITLCISFAGVMGLLVVVFLAPMLMEAGGNYYAGLFGSIGAILAAPALAFIEYEIIHSGKEGSDNELD